MYDKEIIPTYIIEEHNEAFIIWNYAIEHGFISEKGNYLLHVDEHSDMQLPRFNESVNDLDRSLNSLITFTHQELDIATFIIPSIYLEIISSVCWLRQKHDRLVTKQMYVRSFNQTGKKLLGGKIEELQNSRSKFDNKNFTFIKTQLPKLPEIGQKVILDIDLDYFSCTGDVFEARETVVEITESEYMSYQNDRYHRMNFMGFPKLYTAEENGKYYYVINYFKELYPSTARVEKDEIQVRIDSFIETLSSKKIQPAFIDICRSRHSGYTPLDQWEFIENQLIKGLRRIYKTEVQHIDDLVYETAI